ncbi:murein biosynthesis integral membrane protein MurJ [Spirillospora sp. CA-294931]|uniref:murein biosynthesis integral membrane protein MurJ n=1 Tax=Spirillospora sp. CA-294931 TaxID=3240042 RepID=UPI003D8BD262
MEDRGPWRALMPGVIEAAERSEPATEPEPGLVPVRDPGDVSDPGTADRPGSEADEIGEAARAAPPGVAHSSAVMAIGTIFSRATGFLRTVAIGAALGGAALGNAQQTAEAVPYTVYQLLLGGMLASVFVPFLVKRRRQDGDGGDAAEQRLFTAVVAALGVLTVAAVLAADWLVTLYARSYDGRQREVAVLLTRLLLPQIFFIGVSGVASSLLNVRHRFGAPMWAPVVNNLVTIGAALLFLWIAGRGRTVDTVTDGQLVLIGAGSAAGTVLQGVILAWMLWSAGFRWRPRLDLRGSGFGEAARAAVWMLVYIVIAQLCVLVTLNVVNRASREADGSGLVVYNMALVVFQLPYAIIAVSVITALLPRMSEHVADGRRDLVRADFSRGLWLASALLVPLSVGMLVFAVPGATAFFSYGSMSVESARRIGLVLMVFAVMLIPFTLHQLLMRVFYALGDTRTPGLIAIPAGIAQAGTALALLALVPAHRVVIWLPLSYGLFYIVGAIGASLVLRRRLGGMDGRRITRTLVRLYAAALPGLALAAAVVWAFDRMPGDRLPGLLAIVVGGAGGGVLFLLAARLLKIAELGYFTGLARARLARRPRAGRA